MKKLLIALMVMASPAVMAVTLPSTSYTPYSSGDDSYESYTSLGVQLPSTSFVSLGTYEGSCTSKTPGTDACSDCCTDEYINCRAAGGTKADCDAANLECSRYCDGGSLPLGSGLCMLLMAICYGAVKVVREKKF